MKKLYIVIILYFIFTFSWIIITHILLGKPGNSEDIKDYIFMFVSVIVFGALYITEYIKRDKTTAELEKEKEKYQTLFQQNGMIILIISPENGKIYDANDAALEFYGYLAEEIKKLHIGNINGLSESETKERIELIRKVSKRKFSSLHIKSNGELVEVEVNAGAIKVNKEEWIYLIVRDLTGIKIIEKALERSREDMAFAAKKYREIFDNFVDVYLIIRTKRDEAGNIIDCILTETNKAFEKIIGVTREEVLGESIFKIYYEIKDVFINEIVKPAMNNITIKLENFDVGNEKYCNITAFSTEKDICSIIMEDTTNKVLFKKEIDKLKILYENIFNENPIGIGIVDSEERMIEGNHALCKFLGYEREELLKLKVNDLTVIEDMEKEIELKSQNSPHFQKDKRYICKDGSIKWGRLNVSTISPFGDNKNYFLGMVEDIDIRKKYEEEINMMSYAVDQSPAVIIVTDMDGNIIYGNKKASEVTGYELKDIIGKNPKIFASGKQSKVFYEELK